MSKGEPFKSRIVAAGLVGAVGLTLSCAGVPAPLALFAGSVAGNMFATFLSDACDKALSGYETWAQSPDAASRNFDLSKLAGKAIHALVQSTFRSFAKGVPGWHFLESLSRVKAETFAGVIDLPQFQQVSGERLTGLLGDQYGGMNQRTATEGVWYEVLVESLKAQNPGGDLSALNAGTNQGIIAAAERVSAGFAAQFNGELRNDPACGGRGWVAFQATLMREMMELAETHFKSHQEMKAEVRALMKWITGGVHALDASMAGTLLAKDGSLVEQIRELRILAYTQLARQDASLAMLKDQRADDAALRELIAGGPKLKSLKASPAGKMIFRARFIPMLGRNGEMADLLRFLYGEQPVSWWVWHGPAGMGKSRLALELCLAVDQSWSNKPGRDSAASEKNREAQDVKDGGERGGGWLAGFLDLSRGVCNDWSAWVPTRPTLIVVDYASGKADMIGRWIEQLTQAHAEHNAAHPESPRPPVRFLLLDRDANPQWIDRLRSAAGTPEVVENARYTELAWAVSPSRELPPLSEQDLPRVVEAVYASRRAGGDAPKDAAALMTPEAVVSRFREADLALRPLFVTLAAHAAFDGKNVAAMDELALVRDWWKDELRQWTKWAQEAHESTPRMKKIRTLMALATLAQGVRLTEGYTQFIENVPDADLRAALPSAEDFAADAELWRRLVSGGDGDDRGGATVVIPEIEPDFFGEVFVLDHIAAFASTDRARRALLRAATYANLDGPPTWLMLAARDMTMDPGLHALLRDALLDEPADTGPLTRALPLIRAYSLAVCAELLRDKGEFSLHEDLFRGSMKILQPMLVLGEEAAPAPAMFAMVSYNLGVMLQSFADAGEDKSGRRRGAGAMYTEAEALYRVAAQADPRHAASRFNLALMLIAMVSRGQAGEGAIAEAESFVLKSFEFEAPNLSQLLVYATLLLARGNASAGMAAMGMAFEMARGMPSGGFGLLACLLLYFHRLDPKGERMLPSIKFALFKWGHLRLLALDRNAARAVADGHPQSVWLAQLAAVVEGRAAIGVLDEWPAWNQIPPPP